MPITGKFYEFNDENISRSPTDNGVYALYDGNRNTIYIGKAEGEDGIRNRLQRHKRGDEGACTQDAKYYRREICDNPASREEELLIEYRLEHNRLPICNERVG
jgi:excinuclease UvrABC nuclease subunit